MNPEDIVNLGSGSLAIDGIVQVDLSRLEQIIIDLEAAGSTEEVVVEV